MPTTARNNFVMEDHPALPVTTDQTINQGDLIYWDAAAFSLKPLAASSNVAGKFIGVAMDTTPHRVYTEAGTKGGIRFKRTGVFRFKTTAAETYQPGDNVTVGADAQTVVKSGATAGNRVGIVVLRPPTTPRVAVATPTPESVTGATGVEVWVLVEAKYPTTIS